MSETIETSNKSSIENIYNGTIRESSPETPEEPRKTPRSVGRPAAGRTAQLTLMMDPTLKKNLKKFCVDQEKSVAAVIEDLVRKLLENNS